MKFVFLSDGHCLQGASAPPPGVVQVPVLDEDILGSVSIALLVGGAAALDHEKLQEVAL